MPPFLRVESGGGQCISSCRATHFWGVTGGEDEVGEGGLHAQTQVPGTGGKVGADHKTSLGHVTGYTVQTKSLRLTVGRHPGLPGVVQGQNGSEAGR